MITSQRFLKIVKYYSTFLIERKEKFNVSALLTSIGLAIQH